MNLWILVAFSVLNSVHGSNRWSELDFTAINFAEAKKDRKLTGSVINETEVISEISCQFKCLEDVRCLSYNLVLIQGKTTWICQLSNSDRFIGYMNFTSENGALYRGIQTICEKDFPCAEDEICFPNYRSYQEGHFCRCKECPRNCHDHFLRGSRSDGVYSVYPDDGNPIQVLCDMTTDGGGWTVFQKRKDGSVDFYLGWESYTTGFGNLNGEFWLGNDNLHRLTANSNTTLRVDMEDYSSVRKYAEYTTFFVADASGNYRLTIEGYRGTAGDSMINCPRPAKDMMFTTKDRDNDVSSSNTNCAVRYKGAWWYHYCLCANLNGLYKGGGHAQGVVWRAFRGLDYSLKYVEMKLRPTNAAS